MSALLQFAQAQVQAARLQLEAAERLLEEAKMEQVIDDEPAWVYIDEAAERIKLSKNAIYRRVSQDWTEGIQYKRERPGKKSRLLINLTEVRKWMENIGAFSSTEVRSESGLCGTESRPLNPSTSTRPRQTGKQPPACVMKFLKK